MPYSAGQQLHKCYIAHRSVPIAHTEGTFTFFYGQDYTDGGWYSLRYFAGESGGTVCEVREPLSTLSVLISIPVTITIWLGWRIQLLDHASLRTHNHTLTYPVSLALVVMMRSKEIKI